MSLGEAVEKSHPKGEVEIGESAGEPTGCSVETYAGKLHIRWDDSAAVTAMGQMPVFVDFLKTSGLWDAFLADCPLRYTSPNAPSRVNILGTLLMSVLAGQSRYAHISGLRGDGVNPELLGMSKVMSEDSARRAFKQAAPEAAREWLKRHLRQTYAPLLEQAWVLDLDSTVNTALVGGADILCTLDKHFYEPNVLSFCARYKIRLTTDIELLNFPRKFSPAR